MPWLHIDWGAEGNLNRIVMTDDDADVIAECTNIRIERDGSKRGYVSMDFVVEDLDKFNEATTQRVREETRTKAVKKKAKKSVPLKNKLGEIRKTERDWNTAKWEEKEWRDYYNEISHDLDGMSKDDLLDEAEWCELVIPRSMLKADIRKAILEHWADEEYARKQQQFPPLRRKKVKS